MKKSAKKAAGFDCNQNQLEVGQDVQTIYTNNYTTGESKMQGLIPVFFMPEETAESWNAKARRINREAEMREMWYGESNDPETQDWRYELTAEEAELVNAWDEQSNVGLLQLCQNILKLSEVAV